MFYVSRQSYFYNNGAYGVEIATQQDHISPGALGPKYGEAISAHPDPRNAAAAAIELAERWRGDIGEERLPADCFTIAASSACYPTLDDAIDAEERHDWAAHRFAAMPNCERCGDVEDAHEWQSPDGGCPVIACSEHCAEALLAGE